MNVYDNSKEDLAIVAAMQAKYDAGLMDPESADSQPQIGKLMSQLLRVHPLSDRSLSLEIRKTKALTLLEGFESLYGLTLLCLVGQHWHQREDEAEMLDDIMVASLVVSPPPALYQVKKTLGRFYLVLKEGEE